MEFQIRTKEMHATAEIGIASHWAYKENPSIHAKKYKDITLLKNIQKRELKNDKPKDFIKELKMDLYTDEIFTSVVESRNRIASISIGVTILAILLGILFSWSISKPINKLTNVVDDVSKGKLDVTLEKSSIYEANKLIRAIDRVMTSMKRAIKRLDTEQ